MINRSRVSDSTLAYFINQLDNFDRTLHEPLYNVTWMRDIKLRTGVTMANESTSFTRMNVAAGGSQAAQQLPWVSANTTAIPGVGVDGELIVTPLKPCSLEISYSSIELERSQLIGQSIDQQKFLALNIKYQMSTDQVVYVGDSWSNTKGLLNNPNVASAAVAATGTGTSTLWKDKTADQILADVNEALNAAWEASGYAVCPDKLLLPPLQFSMISSMKVSNAGNVSVLKYIKENSICLTVNGRELDIQPVKWLKDATIAGNRMVAYSNQENYVRFPMVPIRRETPYYRGISYFAPYVWAYGATEFVYPETAIYRDGI